MVTLQKKWYSGLRHFWIFIPAFLLFRTVNHYSVNIPWSDDYDAILSSLLDFKKATGFHEKFRLLFAQHNEHRIFFSRLVWLSCHTLFGHLNFRLLTFLGDIQVLITFFISIYFIRRAVPKYWSLLAFVWGLCLFDLNTYENAGVAMTSMANNSVVMWFFISLYFYSKEKRAYLPAAALAQFLCVYSSGNGNIGSLILAGYALFTGDRLKCWCAVAVLVIFTPLYFVGYYTPGHETIPRTPEGMVRFFLGMAGSHFNHPHGARVAILLLLILALVFPYKALSRPFSFRTFSFRTFFFTKREREDQLLLPIIFILAFVIATMAAAGVFRSNVVGVAYFGSKYLIYPNLMDAIIFLLIVRKLFPSPAASHTAPAALSTGTPPAAHATGPAILPARKRPITTTLIKWRWAIISGCMIALLCAYAHNYEIGDHDFASEHNKLINWYYYFPDATRAKMLTEEACKAGIYCRPHQ
ncbi:MAG TPA: hypothetical protein VI233_05170 [Puia sp.]